MPYQIKFNLPIKTKTNQKAKYNLTYIFTLLFYYNLGTNI